MFIKSSRLSRGVGKHFFLFCFRRLIIFANYPDDMKAFFAFAFACDRLAHG